MDIHTIIQSQYHASLDMLDQTIEKCPVELWNRKEDKNKFWHLAYHTLFYTQLYLSPSFNEFEPWAKHRPEYNFMGTLPEPPYDKPKIGEPYTRDEIIEYLEYLRSKIDEMVTAVDLHAKSGFEWLPFSKLELQFYNIRHLMQHTGELGERLGFAAQIDIDWVGKRKIV
ncbi:MAG: DinB family protein [Chloroflexota bacterium]